MNSDYDQNGITINISELKIEKLEFSDQHLKLIFNRVGSRAYEILILRFGVRGNKRQTLQEIGDAFAITRERVRQIQELALSKIRHPSFSNIAIKINLINFDSYLRSGKNK